MSGINLYGKKTFILNTMRYNNNNWWNIAPTMPSMFLNDTSTRLYVNGVNNSANNSKNSSSKVVDNNSRTTRLHNKTSKWSKQANRCRCCK